MPPTPPPAPITGFKATLDGEIRKFTHPTPSTATSSTTAAVCALQATIAATFRKHVASLSWFDEDGDAIAVKTDLDLVEAIRAATGGTVKLTVTAGACPPSPPAPVPAALAAMPPANGPSKMPATPNFSASSSAITVTAEGQLKASCKDSSSQLQDSILDLVRL